MALADKIHRLKSIIGGCESAVIAFSGGVDSSVVCAAAREVLGDKAIAVTALSPTHPKGEPELAKQISKQIGIKHVTTLTKELENPEFAANPPDRCYHCKKELFTKLDELRREWGLNCLMDGTNCDDWVDYRPGLRAEAEFGVINPLTMAGMGKEDVRRVAVVYGLPNAEKPANPCLASRIPCGQKITVEKLDRIAKAEEFLHDLDIKILRLRDHGDLARIEVRKEELSHAFGLRDKIVEHLKTLGYKFVALDLEGYRMGSLNVKPDVNQG